MLKGWWDMHALDFDAPLSSNVTIDPVYGGTCVHVNAAGAFELGHIRAKMPIFLIQGSQEHDVANPGGNEWYAASPTGKQSGLVATGGYELETTEFYNPGNVAYVPGDCLHAPTEGQINTTPGKVFAGKLFKARSWAGGSAAVIYPTTDSVCGIVSRANHVNHHRVPVLSFWPVWAWGPANEA